MTNLYYDLSYFSALSVVVPLVFCLIYYKALNITLRALFFYLIISAVAELISFYFIYHNIENYFVLNVFTVVECILINYIYYTEFSIEKIRKIIILGIAGFLCTTYFLFVYNKGYDKEDNVISTVESLMVIALSFSFFYTLFLEMKVPKLTHYYFFWINCAFLIYFSISFFLFLFDDYLEKCDISIAYILWSVHLITNIACNILFAVGVWNMKRK